MTQLQPRMDELPLLGPRPLPRAGRPTDASAPARLDALFSAVDDRLADFFDERVSLSAAYGDGYERLWQGARAAADGGKRLRPRFVLAAFDALGGDRRPGGRESALDTAVAFELLHTAFLLHDDVIDGDTTRRGRLNVLGEFRAHALRSGADDERAHRLGEAAAILAGDLLLHAAASTVARLDVPAP